MRYDDVRSFVKDALTTKGYGTTGHPDMPLLDPGPPAVAKLLKKSPNAIVFLTLGNGIGLAKEGLFDLPFITVRVVGKQNDFTGAETLAYDVDSILLAVDGNTTVGTARTLYITRTGGAPQLIDVDDAERYQFQATYITETKR